MKWGVRRFQNEDDSLTAQGKQRYDGNPANNTEGSSTKKFTLTENQKKRVKRGAIAVDLILAACGGYKLSQTELVKKLADDVASKIDNELYQKKSK